MNLTGIPYKNEVRKYLRNLLKHIKVRAVVLYGSASRKTHGVGSDVDILVVADTLPKEFLKRLSIVNDLNETSAPIEAIAYTSTEFEQSMKKGHAAIFDALEDGLVLFDDGLFKIMRQRFSSIKRQMGLTRTECGWEKAG